jgi:hypothetical protein
MLLILGRMAGPMEAKAKPPGIWGYNNLYTEHSQCGEEECHKIRGYSKEEAICGADVPCVGRWETRI